MSQNKQYNSTPTDKNTGLVEDSKISSQQIGALRATALVAGNMIGSGILLAPAILAPYGAMSIIGWILTTIGALSLALAFSKLSVWIPKSGGPYTFARHIFGDFVGFQSAWGYWFSAWCGSVSLLVGGIQYMSIFWPEIATNKTFTMAFGLGMIALFTFINSLGLKRSTFVEIVILFIKVSPLVVVAFYGIFFIDLSSVLDFSGINAKSFSSLGAMAPVLLWGFIGLESATIPAENVVNPKKTIPIATICGVLIVATVYICGAIVISGLLPNAELIASKAPYVDAASKLFGNFGSIIMIATGLAGIYGSLNGWILIQGRVPYEAAKEGLFPSVFLKTNSKGVPIFGILSGSFLMAIMFIATYNPSVVQHVELLIDLAVMAMLLPYFYCAVAFCYLAVCRKKELSLLEQIGLAIVGVISLAYTFLSFAGAGEKLVSFSTIMLLLFVPFFCLTKKNQGQGQAQNQG